MRIDGRIISRKSMFSLGNYSFQSGEYPDKAADELHSKASKSSKASNMSAHKWQGQSKAGANFPFKENTAGGEGRGHDKLASISFGKEGAAGGEGKEHNLSVSIPSGEGSWHDGAENIFSHKAGGGDKVASEFNNKWQKSDAVGDNFFGKEGAAGDEDEQRVDSKIILPNKACKSSGAENTQLNKVGATDSGVHGHDELVGATGGGAKEGDKLASVSFSKEGATDGEVHGRDELVGATDSEAKEGDKIAAIPQDKANFAGGNGREQDELARVSYNKESAFSDKESAFSDKAGNHDTVAFSYGETQSKKDSLCNKNRLDSEGYRVLMQFDKVIRKVRKVPAASFAKLHIAIKELSALMTSSRDSRRLSYMNDVASLTAYAYYFEWWNLVRLTALLPTVFCEEDFVDGETLLDIGSGPLTIPIALWIAFPKLRKKRLQVYCLDISKSALSLGEALFHEIAGESQWKIIRVTGGLGTAIKSPIDKIFCANVFNEFLQDEADYQSVAASNVRKITGYFSDATQNAAHKVSKKTIFLVEPSAPESAVLLSNMRNSLLQDGWGIISPCPHSQKCPMALPAKHGGRAKWCNFAFSTDSSKQRVPKTLLKLSQKAKLLKSRCVVSYVVATAPISRHQKNPPSQDNFANDKAFFARITSDEIKFPWGEIAHYACSAIGLILVVVVQEKVPALQNGDLIEFSIKTQVSHLQKDPKSGIPIIRLAI